MFSAARRRRRGWRYRTIFASGWLRRLSSAACRATRRPSVSGSPSPARCAGCSASAPAARFRRLRRAGIAGPGIEAHRDYLLGLIRRQPDLTLLEIQERGIANRGERFSSSVIWRLFDRHEITFKKTAHAEEQQRPDVVKRRQEWFGAQLDLDPRKLAFIDETGASTNLARKGGRCRRGRRLRVGIPHGHSKTVTLVAGLRFSGLVAQKAFDKPMNAVTFEEWVEKCLVPNTPNTLERRHRRHGQSVEPQGAKGRATHRGGGSRVAISAALQS